MKIIKEKIFNISLKDVEEIYNQVKNDVYKIFPNFDTINVAFFKKNSFSFQVLIKKITPFIFDSIDCQVIASDIPIQINFGIVKGNVTLPPLSLTDKSYPYIINFGFNLARLKEIKTIIIENGITSNISFSEIEKYMTVTDYDEFKLYFNEDRLKNAITHELTHWVDDYNHNSCVRKAIEIQKFNNPTEVNAQIHVIAMLKLRNDSIWDKIDIFDLLSKDQSLKDTYRRLSTPDKKEAIKWVKVLMKRMYKEKLLGKNMNFIPANDMKLMEDFNFDNFFNEKYYNIKDYI